MEAIYVYITFHLWGSHEFEKLAQAVMNECHRRTNSKTLYCLSEKKRRTSSLQDVQHLLEQIDGLRGNSVLTREERLVVLRVFFAIHKDSSITKTTCNAYEKTSKLLRRSVKTISNVLKEWTDAQNQSTEPALDVLESCTTLSEKGNHDKKHTRIVAGSQTYFKVRDFVRERHINYQRVTATQVYWFLVAEKLIDANHELSASRNQVINHSAIRCVQRFLVHNGFKRGKRSAGNLQNSHIIWRNRYLRVLMQNRTKPERERFREFYLDKSYIHQHFSRLGFSVWDPNDSEDRPVKVPQKGNRFCFCAAIQESIEDEPAGSVPGSAWIFSPQDKSGHKGDYHRNFNGANFLSWFSNSLLPNLSRPSMIILDNAKYHKVLPESTPVSSKMRKADILTTLSEVGVQFDDQISTIEARALLNEWIAENVRMEIVKRANEAGRKFLWTPPRYSDLQPIELVWTHVKSNMGKQYKKGTTLKDIKARLDPEFKDLQTEVGRKLIASIISSVDKTIQKFTLEIEREEEAHDEGKVTDNSESSHNHGN